MNKNLMILLAIVVSLVLVVIAISFVNTCKVGGFVGSSCNCNGVKLPLLKSKVPDGLEEYLCIGTIQE